MFKGSFLRSVKSKLLNRVYLQSFDSVEIKVFYLFIFWIGIFYMKCLYPINSKSSERYIFFCLFLVLIWTSRQLKNIFCCFSVFVENVKKVTRMKTTKGTIPVALVFFFRCCFEIYILNSFYSLSCMPTVCTCFLYFAS